MLSAFCFRLIGLCLLDALNSCVVGIPTSKVSSSQHFSTATWEDYAIVPPPNPDSYYYYSQNQNSFYLPQNQHVYAESLQDEYAVNSYLSTQHKTTSRQVWPFVKIPNILRYLPGVDDTATRLYAEVVASLRKINESHPEFVTELDLYGTPQSTSFDLKIPPGLLPMLLSPIIMTTVIDIPNSLPTLTLKNLFESQALNLQAKLHLIEHMPKQRLISTIRIISGVKQGIWKSAPVMVTAVSTLSSGNVASVDWMVKETYMTMSLFLIKGLTVTHPLFFNKENEVRLLNFLAVLAKSKELWDERLATPVCQLFTNRMADFFGKRLVQWGDRSNVVNMYPLLQCLGPTLLIDVHKSYDLLKSVGDALAAEPSIDEATCVTLAEEVERDRRLRKKLIVLHPAAFGYCRPYLTPQFVIENPIPSLDSKLYFVHNSRWARIADSLLSQTLIGWNHGSEFERLPTEERLLLFVHFMHVLSTDEVRRLLDEFQADGSVLNLDYVAKLPFSTVRLAVEAYKSGRPNQDSDLALGDLEVLGPLSAGVELKVFKDYWHFFKEEQNRDLIKILNPLQRRMIIANLRNSRGMLSISRLREFGRDLIEDLSAYDLLQSLEYSKDSLSLSLDKNFKILKEQDPTESLANVLWTKRTAQVIISFFKENILLTPDEKSFDFTMYTVEKKNETRGIMSYQSRLRMNGNLAESLQKLARGITSEDIDFALYTDVVSLIYSLQSELGEDLDRGLAQYLAQKYMDVFNDFLSEKYNKNRVFEFLFRYEVYMLGGRVLRELDPEFLTLVPPNLCREAIGLIGNLGREVSRELPRSMRKHFVSVYMDHCKRGKDSLNVTDLIILGSFVCDLKPSHIDKLSNDDVVNNLYLFSNCPMTISQGSSLAKKLENNGHLSRMTPLVLKPLNIHLLRSTICSMVGLDEMASVGDADTIEAFPYIWLDLEPFLLSQLTESVSSLDIRMSYFEGMSVFDKSRITQCFVKAVNMFLTRKRRLTNFQKYEPKICSPLKNFDKEPGINGELRLSENPSFTCAELKDIGPAILLLTEQHFSEMNICQLERCLEHISTYPYLSETILRSIKNKIVASRYIPSSWSARGFSDQLIGQSLSAWSVAASSDVDLLLSLKGTLQALTGPEVSHLPPDEYLLFEMQNSVPGTRTLDPKASRRALHQYALARAAEEAEANDLSSSGRRDRNGGRGRIELALSEVEVVMMGNLLCGLDMSLENMQLSLFDSENNLRLWVDGETFRRTLHVWGHLTQCSWSQRKQLKIFYYTSGSRGTTEIDPSHLEDLGPAILGTLSNGNLDAMSRHTISHIPPSAIAQLPAETVFKQADQRLYKSLTPEQIRSLLKAHWSVLGEEDKAILLSTLCGQSDRCLRHLLGDAGESDSTGEGGDGREESKTGEMDKKTSNKDSSINKDGAPHDKGDDESSWDTKAYESNIIFIVKRNSSDQQLVYKHKHLFLIVIWLICMHSILG